MIKGIEVAQGIPDLVETKTDGSESVTTVTSYDTAGQIHSVVKTLTHLPTGKRTRIFEQKIEYDSNGDKAREETHTSAGTSTQLVYERGLLSEETYSDSNPAHSYKARFTYDRNKDITSYTKEYANGARAVTTFGRDIRGDPVKETFHYTSPYGKDFTSTYEYDEKGLPKREFSLTLDGGLYITTYSYSDGLRYPSQHEDFTTGKLTRMGEEAIGLLQLAGLIPPEA